MTSLNGAEGPTEVRLATTYHRVVWSINAALAFAAGIGFVVTWFTFSDTPARFVVTFVLLGLGICGLLSALSTVIVTPGDQLVCVRNPFRTVVVPFNVIADVDVKEHSRRTNTGSFMVYQARLRCHDGRQIRCRALTGIGPSGQAVERNADRLRRLVTSGAG